MHARLLAVLIAATLVTGCPKGDEPVSQPPGAATPPESPAPTEAPGGTDAPAGEAAGGEAAGGEAALVCCESVGYGAQMVRCCETYEWTTAEACVVPEGFVGGGKSVVSDDKCAGVPRP